MSDSPIEYVSPTLHIIASCVYYIMDCCMSMANFNLAHYSSLVHAGSPSASVGGIAGGVIAGVLLLIIAIIATAIVSWKLT